MGHCDKCNVDFEDSDDEKVKEHKHEDAPAEEAAPAEGEKPAESSEDKPAESSGDAPPAEEKKE